MSARRNTLLAAIATTICLATPATPAPFAAQGHANPPIADDPAVITDWSAIAARTIFTENATPIPSSGLYFGLTSLAVHDAVASIEGGYRLYRPQPRPQSHASPEAAAATAAYRVLRHYFPGSAEKLAASYATSLAGIPKGVGLVHGKRAGEAAATAVIASREDLGRDTKYPGQEPDRADSAHSAPAPGVWRPTPEAFAPMLVPWLGFVPPLLLTSPLQFPLPGPDPITTDAYARDFAEVKAMGAKEGSSRSAEQTQKALFYNSNSVLQYQQGLADQVTRRGLDIQYSARAFALLNAGTADALVACWRAKYDYAYWRPITAIREADGNPATEPDPAWSPLVPTPPYGDYVSGHACITGAASEVMSHLFGRDTLDLNLTSSATLTTRHYERAEVLDTDTMNARIWLGLHFRKAMTDGNRLGHSASAWGITHYLAPLR